MDYLCEADDLVLEYLVFRGFLESYQSVVRERASDQLHGLNADRVAQELVDASCQGPLQRLVTLWGFVEQRCGLDGRSVGGVALTAELATSAARLKSGLFKLYLVRCKARKADSAVVEFFASGAVAAQKLDHDEWQPWCSLAFSHNPAQDKLFSVFFEPDWQTQLAVSLANLVAQAFRTRPAPKLLAFPLANQAMNALRAQLKAKELECEKLSEQVERQRAMLGTKQSHRDEPSEDTTEADAEDPVKQTHPALGGLVCEDAQDEKPLGVRLLALGKHDAKVNKCRFSPDSHLICSASSDHTVRLWRTPQVRDIAGPLALETLSEEQVILCASAALSIDWNQEKSNLLAIGTSNSCVKFWDSDLRAEKTNLVVSGDLSLPFVTDVRFCTRRQLFATVCSGHNNKSSSSAPGSNSHPPFPSLLRQQGPQRSLVCLWNSASLQQIKSFDTEDYVVSSVALNQNGSLLLTGNSDGTVRVFDMQKGGAASIMHWKADACAGISRICLSADETAVITLSESGQVASWSMHKVSSKVCSMPGIALRSDSTGLEGVSSDLLLKYGDIALGPDSSKQFATCSPAYGRAFFVNDSTSMPEGKSEPRCSGHSRAVTSLDWAPTVYGSLICSGSLDRSIRVVQLLV